MAARRLSCGGALRQRANVARSLVFFRKSYKSALIEIIQTGSDRIAHLFFLDGLLLPARLNHPQALLHHIAGVAKLASLYQICYQGLVMLTQNNVTYGHFSSLSEQRSGITVLRKD